MFEQSEARSELFATYRLYGRLLADLERRMSGSEFRLSEWRVLLELACQPDQTNAGLVLSVGLDRAHLSRTVKALIERDLVQSRPFGGHKSQRLLSLSASGQTASAAVYDQWTSIIETQLKALAHRDMGPLLASPGHLAKYRKHKPELRKLNAASYAWLIERAAVIGNAELRSVSEAISKFINFDRNGLASAAWVNERIGGASIAVPDADQLICEIVALYVEPEIWGAAASLLLGDIIDVAKDISFARVTAWAGPEEKALTHLLEGHGFVASSEKRIHIVGHAHKTVVRQREFVLTF